MWPFKKKAEAEPPVQTVSIHELVGGVYPALVAYRIDNGYLVRFATQQGAVSTLKFCTTEQEVGELMVAERAKEAMGIRNAEKAARYGVNPAYAPSPTVSLTGAQAQAMFKTTA